MTQSSLTRRENDLAMAFPALKDRAKLIMPLRGKDVNRSVKTLVDQPVESQMRSRNQD
jgi:hypothetical protein